MSDQQSPVSPTRKIVSWLGYLAAIGLLLFIAGTILYSIWAIFTTTDY